MPWDGQSAPLGLVFEDVRHKLGLEFLRAKLAAHGERPLLPGDIVIPGAQGEHGGTAFLRRPHQPPVIGLAFQLAAVGTGAAEN